MSSQILSNSLTEVSDVLSVRRCSRSVSIGQDVAILVEISQMNREPGCDDALTDPQFGHMEQFVLVQ